MSGPARVLVEDLPQRHKDDLGFLDRHDLDFILRTLGVSAVSLRAKQSQSSCRDRNGREPARSPRPLPLGQSVRNKANSSRAARRTSTFWKKSYDTLDTRHASVKQSQFPPGQQWVRVGKLPVPPVGPRVRNKANFRGQAGVMDIVHVGLGVPHLRFQRLGFTVKSWTQRFLCLVRYGEKLCLTISERMQESCSS